MRAVFGVLSLLFVVAVVGFLAKKQLASTPALTLPSVAAPADSSANPAKDKAAAPAAAANVKEQSQQTQAQFKAALESAMQPARALPDEKP